MKNLTPTLLTVTRQDGSRVSLKAAPQVPIIRVEESCLLGYLGSVEVYRERIVSVDFTGIELKEEDQPFIVTREVFDALPADMHEFVTPDMDSAMFNSFGVLHVVNRFIAKRSAKRPESAEKAIA